MSAWVIALGLSAGYLINKNLQLTEKLDEQIKVHHARNRGRDGLLDAWR